MIKHLIFDCGGVLVYPRLGDWKLPFGMKAILGVRARDVYTSKYLLAQQASEQWLDEARLVMDTDEERYLRREFIRSIDAYMNWHMSPQEIQQLGDDFTDNIQRYGFFRDVNPWLRRWKQRFSLGVLSDAMPSILVFLEQYGILDLFDAAVISTHVGALKPNARMFSAILTALNAQPEECLFVDDRVCNVEGAAAVGMRAVQMARSAFLPDSLWGGPVAASFEELNGLIEA